MKGFYHDSENLMCPIVGFTDSKGGTFRPLKASVSKQTIFRPYHRPNKTPNKTPIQAAEIYVSNLKYPAEHRPGQNPSQPRRVPDPAGFRVSTQEPFWTQTSREAPLHNPSRRRSQIHFRRSHPVTRSWDQHVSNYTIFYPSLSCRLRPTGWEVHGTNSTPLRTKPDRRHLVQSGRKLSTDPAMVPVWTIQAVAPNDPKSSGMVSKLTIVFMYPMSPIVTTWPHRY